MRGWENIWIFFFFVVFKKNWEEMFGGRKSADKTQQEFAGEEEKGHERGKTRRPPLRKTGR